MGDFRNKNSADWFQGKKYPALKKIYLLWRIMLKKKNSYTIESREKKFLPNPDHPYPPPPLSSIVKWSTPKDKIEGLWTGYHCPGMYEFEYVV